MAAPYSHLSQPQRGAIALIRSQTAGISPPLLPKRHRQPLLCPAFVDPSAPPTLIRSHISSGIARPHSGSYDHSSTNVVTHNTTPPWRQNRDHDYYYDPLHPEDDLPSITTPITHTKHLVRQNENVILPCAVEKLGAFSLTWQHEDNILWILQEREDGPYVMHVENDPDVSRAGSSLSLSNVTSEDSGNYTCQVNTQPPRSLTHTLQVRGGAMSPLRQTGKEGGTGLLEENALGCSCARSSMPASDEARTACLHWNTGSVSSLESLDATEVSIRTPGSSTHNTVGSSSSSDRLDGDRDKAGSTVGAGANYSNDTSTTLVTYGGAR
ncbi:hypothetical protein Pcinc_017021 [Petrolisthes cinctipes]|uniref:Ig-like domain-containing protein n=1 Tax=Petrolisthes cinctipes TaxID=88211 RepID=A0AAE1KP94_PETCI|nr:hypothetical protein Pcinc_017021 [Petrolisthes cinctipes]